MNILIGHIVSRQRMQVELASYKKSLFPRNREHCSLLEVCLYFLHALNKISPFFTTSDVFVSSKIAAYLIHWIRQITHWSCGETHNLLLACQVYTIWKRSRRGSWLKVINKIVEGSHGVNFGVSHLALFPSGTVYLKQGSTREGQSSLSANTPSFLVLDCRHKISPS
jgi:hypothetical protein